MGVLEQVTQMKNQGIPENEIVNKLQEQNISPKAINDALNQSRVKEAVSKQVPEEGMETSITSRNTSPARNSTREQETAVPNDEFYIPQSRTGSSRSYPATQEYEEQEQNYQQPYPEGYGQDYADYGNYGGQTGYSEEYYPQQGYAPDYSRGYGADNMIEIAEQVFSEKVRKMQKQIEDLNEFKVLAETKLTHAEHRLKRIEETIDKLQMSILEKIGSYGRGLENIKKEMLMMQNSFSKTLPILASRHTPHTPTKHTTKRTSKKKSRK